MCASVCAHILLIGFKKPERPFLARPLYQRLVEMCNYDGSVLVPDNQLTEAGVISVFQKLAEDVYAPFKGTLKCGHLESKIVLYPNPTVSHLHSTTSALVSRSNLCR